MNRRGLEHFVFFSYGLFGIGHGGSMQTATQTMSPTGEWLAAIFREQHATPQEIIQFGMWINAIRSDASASMEIEGEGLPPALRPKVPITKEQVLALLQRIRED